MKMNFEKPKTLPGVEKKINEYVDRIKSGEDKSLVLQGLGPSFISAVEAQLAPPENVHIAEQSAEYSRNDSIEKVAKNESFKKLNGWPASYQLAKIAQEEGVDLSLLSREDYAEYAIKNHLAIDGAQLRAHPSQRNGTSVDEVIMTMKTEKTKIKEEVEKEFARFSHQMMQLAEKPQSDRFLFKDVRVLSATKDSGSWLFFSINNGTNQQEVDTFKSYFAMKDLNDLTPERFKGFMKFLQENGYNGGIKIFQDMTEQGTSLNDQVVMHGYSESDAKKALQLAEQYFKEEIGTKSFGKDEIIDGISKSYSEILAEQIKRKLSN